MEAALVKTVVRIALVMIAFQTGNQFASAQRNAMAIGHSVGRYLGYGWTKGGYQAGYANHQFPVVKYVARNRGYVSNGLHYPYSPGYQPFSTMPSAPMMQSGTPNYGSVQRQDSMQGSVQQGAAPTPAPTEPPTPSEPPPEWLKKYLDENKQEKPEEVPAPEADLLAEPKSPSDIDNSPFRFKEELNNGLNDALDGTLDDSLDDSLDGGLDDGLGDDDMLLDSDDDDDLLLDDSFTYRRKQARPKKTAQTNRYQLAYPVQQYPHHWRR